MTPGEDVGRGVGGGVVVRGDVARNMGSGKGGCQRQGSTIGQWNTRRSLKEHIIIVTESKAAVVPDRGWNPTTSSFGHTT